MRCLEENLEILSDHKALQWCKSVNTASGRLSRWMFRAARHEDQQVGPAEVSLYKYFTAELPLVYLLACGAAKKMYSM